MKMLLSIVVVLFIIKVYASNTYNEEVRENKKASQFIEYDLDTKRLEDLIDHQRTTISDQSKLKSTLYNAAKELFDKLDASESASIEEILLIFNTATFKDLIKYPPINYKENKGLSYEHNQLMVLSSGYSSVLSKLIEKKIPTQKEKEKPYLISLQRRKDSMDLMFGFAMYGEIEGALFTYKGDTIKVNSLPINIGPVKGDVSFLFTDPVTEKNICYRKRY